jgi:ABC-type Zn uptake system ZnuABC Zn-binding protein ZnuA
MSAPARNSWLASFCRLGCFLYIALSSCSKPPEPTAEDFLPSQKFKVVASTIQLAQLVQEIGGDTVVVECLTAPKIWREVPAKLEDGTYPVWNPNPFLWKPRASDLFDIQTSHLVVINGLGLERAMASQIPQLEKEGVVLVDVGASLDPAEILTLRHDPSQPDPTIWNSPRLWKQAAIAVAAGLKKLVPPEAGPYYDRRAHTVEDRLTRLIAWTEEKLSATAPKGERYILTSLDTLQYFARDFGIEAKAIWTAQGEPLQIPADELSTWLKDHQVIHILPDYLTPADAINEVIDKLGVIKQKTIYTVIPDRPGTKQMGLLETHDVNTHEGTFRALVRTMERRLGKPKSAAPSPTAPEDAAPAEDPAPSPP